VSLAEVWGIPTLPQIFCESSVAGGRRVARCSTQLTSAEPASWFDLADPVRLVQHREGKPWGAELWFTGIEKRGVSGVETMSGERMSLAAYLTVLAGEDKSRTKAFAHVPLLKILDPLPEPEKGCLYIEVHTEKWETYIITAVDARIWPDGRGRVLYGFSKSRIEDFEGNEANFKAALLEDVRSYEKIRRAIDSSDIVDNALRVEEQAAWERVRAYFGFLEVEVGSVVRVPPFIPHSLQNGVQVVEFQTPTYERLVLAFNQKVLTQNHWDTEAALSAAVFKTTQQLAGDTGDFSAEGISGWKTVVEFPEFIVKRAQLASQSSLFWSSRSEATSLLFVVEGRVRLSDSENRGRTIDASAGEALLLPPGAVFWSVESEGGSPAIILSV
jgi:mannose-6-phosphate isomerase-like protein (cupin superfamily)